MKKLIQPYSLLFYLLTLMLFFLIGVSYAKVTGAANEQMLASGAIVLGYGVIFAFLALMIGLVLVYHYEYTLIKRLSKIFGASLLILISYYVWNYHYKVKPQQIEKSKIEIPKKKPRLLCPNRASSSQNHNSNNHERIKSNKKRATRLIE